MNIGDCVCFKSPWDDDWPTLKSPNKYIGIIVNIEILPRQVQCQILKSDNTIVMCPQTILKVMSKFEVGEKK